MSNTYINKFLNSEIVLDNISSKMMGGGSKMLVKNYLLDSGE